MTATKKVFAGELIGVDRVHKAMASAGFKYSKMAIEGPRSVLSFENEGSRLAFVAIFSNVNGMFLESFVYETTPNSWNCVRCIATLVGIEHWVENI